MSIFTIKTIQADRTFPNFPLGQSFGKKKSFLEKTFLFFIFICVLRKKNSVQVFSSDIKGITEYERLSTVL